MTPLGGLGLRVCLMNSIKRKDGRADDSLRPISLETGVQPYAEGSALIRWGRTQVLCAVSVSPEVPGWLKGRGKGWITAQYAMLPRATFTRNPRAGYDDAQVKGRAQEIQRLIGRSLRAGVDLALLGERLLTVDCDVLVADGGTRCASITGAWVAVRLALSGLLEQGVLERDPAVDSGAIWAVSAGLVDGNPPCWIWRRTRTSGPRQTSTWSFPAPGPLSKSRGPARERGYSWSEVETLHRLCQGGPDRRFKPPKSRP